MRHQRRLEEHRQPTLQCESWIRRPAESPPCFVLKPSSTPTARSAAWSCAFKTTAMVAPLEDVGGARPVEAGGLEVAFETFDRAAAATQAFPDARRALRPAFPDGQTVL